MNKFVPSILCLILVALCANAYFQIRPLLLPDEAIDSGTTRQMPNFGDLRLVILRFTDGHRSDYILHTEQVEKFVKACKQLHYAPGVNPHNGNSAAKLEEIAIGEPERGGPYWWSTPDLQHNYDYETGAMIYDFSRFRVVWRAPEG